MIVNDMMGTRMTRLTPNGVCQLSIGLRRTVFFNCQLSIVNCQLLLVVLILVFSACSEAEVKYPSVSGCESAVAIIPLTAISSGTKYYFYDAQGSQPVILDATGSDGSFRGQLAAGTYRLLAVDTGVQGVEFRGMDTFSSASVYLSALSAGVSPSAGLSLVSQPAGEVYALSIDVVVVEEGKSATYYVDPVSLTRTLTLNLDLSRLSDEIAAVSGLFNGVYPGVRLSSRAPLTENAPVTAVSFDTAGGSSRFVSRARSISRAHSVSRATTFAVSVRSFGLLDPGPASSSGGGSYKSELQLTLVTAGGRSLAVSVNLTEAISAGLSSGSAQIKIDVPIEDPEPVPDAPATGVENWTQGGEIELTVEN
jgi:hypothetical protein